MSEPTMPSERVSRERRDRVAKEIERAEERLRTDFDVGWLNGRTRTQYMADAATAAILPDRAEFTVMLARLIAAAYEDGMEGRAVPQDASNMVPFIALVYGDDDASGGTR